MSGYMTYDECVRAGHTPEPLYIGAAILRAVKKDAPLVTAKAEAPRAPRRERGQYYSVYVGVTQRKGRWHGTWGPRGYLSYTYAMATERDAAVARAKALGRDYLEKRDGTREAL